MSSSETNISETSISQGRMTMATLDSLKPPYREIADRIRDRISTGHYPDGKIPSERALIKHYGVSRATATKALAALESEGLIVRRRGAGAFLKPQKPADERSFVSTLIADMDVREFFSAICGAIANRARSYNLNLIWGAKQEFNELSRNGSITDYIARCKAENIRGVFFVPQDAMGERGIERRNQEIAPAGPVCGHAHPSRIVTQRSRALVLPSFRQTKIQKAEIRPET